MQQLGHVLVLKSCFDIDFLLLLLTGDLIPGHVQLLSEVVGHHFDVTLITIPQRDALCESILEENGVFGLVTITSVAA